MTIAGASQSRRLPRGARLFRPAILCLISVLIAVAFRTVHLRADPPASLSNSRSVFNDGGAYALNARYHFLTGRWISPGDNVYAQAPGYTWLLAGLYKVCPPSLMLLRILSICGTSLCVLWMTVAAYRYRGSKVALVTGCLLAIDWLFVMYGRLELIEGFQSLLIVASLTAALAGVAGPGGWLRTNRESEVDEGSGNLEIATPDHSLPWKLHWVVVSALILAGAFLIKPTAALLALPTALTLGFPALDRVCRPSSRGMARLRAALPALQPPVVYLGCLAMLLLFYRFFFWQPHRLLFVRYSQVFQQNAADLWDVRPPVVCFQILTTPAAWGVSGIPLHCLALAGILDSVRRREPWGLLLSAWCVVGALYFAPQTYRPNRFLVPFEPALTGLAALGLRWLWASGQKACPLNPAVGLGWLAYLWIVNRVHLIYPPALDLIRNEELLAGLVLIVACGALTRRWRPISRSCGRVIAGLLAISALVANLTPYLEWALHPDFSERRAVEELSSLRGLAPVAGDNWCMELTVASAAPAYKIDWLSVQPAVLRRLGVRYLVFDDREPRMRQLYSPWIDTGRRLRRLQVGPYGVVIYRVPVAAVPIASPASAGALQTL